MDDEPPGGRNAIDPVIQSEARFRAAVEATHGTVWTNDAQGRMTGEQVGWARLTGQVFEEYQGYGWSDAVHPDDAQATVDAWNKAVAAVVPFEFEHRLRGRDGQWRRYSVRAIPIVDNAGRIQEWVGVHHDIHDATESRLQLARNAETFEALVRGNPFGVYVVDGAFRLLHISDGAKQVFSNVGGLIGRDFAEIMRLIWTEPFASEAIERFRTTLATGEPYVSPSTIEPRADIPAVEAYDWRIERVSLPDGSHGVVCYFYDLTERKQLEDDLRRALDHTALLMREIEHRVQNSLSIVASLLTLQIRSVSSLEAKEALEAASLRVQAIGRVHRQLYQGDNIKTVEFGQYLRQLCVDIEKTVGRPNLAFTIEADKVELPLDRAVPLGIVANELITNACKYCNPNTPERIIVTLSARDQHLEKVWPQR